MAIEKRSSKRAPKGFLWRVRYPDSQRPGRLLSKSFADPDDAKTFDALWKVEQRRGSLARLDAGQQRVGDYLGEWFVEWKKEKAKSTIRETMRRGDRYILEMAPSREWGEGAIAWLKLRQVTPRVVENWKRSLEKREVGPEVIRKTMGDLQQMFDRALRLDDYPQPYNPVARIPKPALPVLRRVTSEEILSVDQVEALHASFICAKDRESAAIVSAIGYTAIRPGELLALTCNDLQQSEERDENGRKKMIYELVVDKRNSAGTLVEGAKSKKRRQRRVPVPPVIARELEEWMIYRGRRGKQLLFPNTRQAHWTEHDYRNWRCRIYNVAAAKFGLPTNPYALRHTAISLWYAYGATPIEAAAWAGHAPSISTDVYAGLVPGAKGGKLDIDAAIKKARQKAARPLRKSDLAG